MLESHKILAYLLIVVVSGLSTGSHAGTDCSIDVSIACGKTPSATFAGDGRLWATFVQGQHVYVSYSDDRGTAFSAPVKVNPHPEDIYTNGENRPKIRLGKDGQIYLSWTEKTRGMHTGNIRFSYSHDGGKSFEHPRTVNNDGLLTSHRFDQLYVSPSGLVYLAWLDKRDQVRARSSGEKYTGSAAYYAVSTDFGQSFGENFKLADHSCECCRMAIAPAGEDEAVVLWRHIFNANTRDHAIALLSADGKAGEFSRATYDNWQIDACPHHGPDLAYSAPGTYHMAWFSDGDDQKGIYYGQYNFSDGGVASVRAIDSGPGASHPQVLELAGHVFFVWKTFDGERTRIQMIESLDKGETWSAPRTVASTDAGSDHPILVKYADRLFLSWHVEQSYRFEQLWPAAGNRTKGD